MNNQSRSTPKVNSLFLPRRGFLLLLLTVGVMLYILSWMNNLQFQKTANPAFIPQVHQSFCAFRPISSKESLEEEKILKSIAWPKTPSITSNYTFENSSNPLCSNFTILPKVGEAGQWYIGDQLEVSIIIKDYYCYPKTSGGDVLLASLKNRDLQAGVSGQVVDHLNGSYTAVFPLVWEGQAEVEVTLVHPSEAVTVLQRLNSEEPDRVNFRSIFRSGSVSEKTECNICLRPSKRPVCDFTDVHTGEPWFCLKPKNTKLNCTNRINHDNGVFVLNLQKEDKRLFQDKINMKTPILAVGSSSITVYQRKTARVHARDKHIYPVTAQELQDIQLTQTDIDFTARAELLHEVSDNSLSNAITEIEEAEAASRSISINNQNPAVFSGYLESPMQFVPTHPRSKAVSGVNRLKRKKAINVKPQTLPATRRNVTQAEIHSIATSTPKPRKQPSSPRQTTPRSDALLQLQRAPVRPPRQRKIHQKRSTIVKRLFNESNERVNENHQKQPQTTEAVDQSQPQATNRLRQQRRVRNRAQQQQHQVQYPIPLQALCTVVGDLISVFKNVCEKQQ
ncbi:NXPE family member 3-like [Gouania willdenowi]|uniref:NXPE family member 3-like n=1 Tax=Gouania willdenowi TaxID=441366 RepID=UPI001055894D|nr:NXPE family member 3-like [Gouania willdenowi]